MVDLKTIKRGWHNIIVTCDNICESGEGRVKFFIDGKQTYPEQKCICMQPIGFIGNSKSCSQPFGSVSDLRIFPLVIRKKQIDTLSNYHEDLEFEMPDKHLVTLVEVGMVK